MSLPLVVPLELLQVAVEVILHNREKVGKSTSDQKKEE
jgi:hypothetical protein